MASISADDFCTLSGGVAPGLSYIEQLDGAACCTPNRPYMLGHNAALGLSLLFRPACKKWSCPECAEHNKQRWGLIATHGCRTLMDSGKQVYFATVTSHEKLKNQHQCLYVLRKAWPVLRHRIDRKSPKNHFLAIPEHHRDGRLHLHFLSDAAIDTAWLKKNGRETGFGYKNEYDPLRKPEGGGFYVVKYLGKQLVGHQFPKGFRRVRTTQNWPKLPEAITDNGWIFRLVPKGRQLSDLIHELKEVARRVVLTSPRLAWDFVEYGPSINEWYADYSPFIDKINEWC